MNNPIKDNRIVSDYTFATRFLQFLADFYPDAGSWHPILEEEYEYMCLVAKELLDYQKSTCEDKYEKQYFENTKDIIKPDFERYIKLLKNGK